MRKLMLPPVLALLLALALGVMLSQAQPPAPLRTLNSGHHFLPPYTSPRDRFGFDASGSLSEYDVSELHAGWYSDWTANLDPAHPDGVAYVQLVVFPDGADDPYDPAQVAVKPNRTAIAQIATAHPGSLWMIDNEPDSLYEPYSKPIDPDVYAHAYHDFYTYIKELDPTALIANGGIVQPTPCRMEYLDIVWNTYQQTYGEPMPVDVWNIHAFVLYEDSSSSGAGWPPGVDPSCAAEYDIRDGDSIAIFRENLIAFRQWLKDKGQQDKPLIISEYGVLWPQYYPGTEVPFYDEDGRTFTPARVSRFMTETFEIFLYESYPSIGYPEDDHRLVQAWAWYSLSDDYYNGYLFHDDSKELSLMGDTYADYTAALTETDLADLTVRLWADEGPFKQIPSSASYDSLTVTVPVTGAVANLGRAPAAGVVISSPLLGFRSTQDVPARYEDDIAALSLPSLVLTESGLYDLSLVADPARVLDDARRWNNAFTTTVDARADLLIPTMTWAIRSAGTLSQALSVTVTVANDGTWPSPPVSGTLCLRDTQGSPCHSTRRFSVAGIGVGSSVTVVHELASPTMSGFYLLGVEVDSGDVLDEQQEHNNRSEKMILVGQEHNQYLPLVLVGGGDGSSTGAEARSPALGAGIPGVPLRLPPLP